MRLQHAPITGLLVWALAACGDGSGPGDRSFRLSIQGGDEQNAPAGALLPLPLQAAVKNVTGDPVRGVRVRFEVTDGSGAELSDTVATSGFDGIAQVDARLGPTQGAYQVAAFIADQPSQRVTFDARATAPPTLTSVLPAAAEAGDTVTLIGSDFSEIIAGNTVFFGTVRALVLDGQTTSQLRVVVPPCIAPGAVEIRVQVGSVSTNPLTLTYTASSPTLDLAPLQGITVAGTEAGNCLQLEGGGAGYLVVPQYASGAVALQSQAYRLGNESGAAQRVATRSRRSGSEVNALQARFDRSLRLMEHRLAPAAAAAARARSAAALSVSAAVAQAQAETPPLNSTRDFSVLATLDPDNPDFETVTARLKYVGENILLYLDTDAPSGGFSDDQLTRFGRLFDQDLYEIAVRTFGSESDIDDNDRVIVLLTRIVNGLTGRDCSQGFVTGFFYGWDLGSTASTSNKGEIFYSMVPDPAGAFSCAHSLSQVEQLAPATFIHELQHMISYNQHVIVREGSSETIWLNEGLSHVAEELAARHYENKYPPPAGRQNPDAIFPDSAAPFINGDLFNSYSYLLDPAAVSVTAFDEGQGTTEERGAAWLFLRWLGDQRDSTIYGRLVQTSLTSIANVEDKARESFASLFGDFSIALYTDSIPGVPRGDIPARFRFKSRNLRQLYQALYDATSRRDLVPRPFPIAVDTLLYNRAVEGTMVPGTMSFFELQTPTVSADPRIRFSAQGGGFFPVDLKAQVGIFRLP